MAQESTRGLSTLHFHSNAQLLLVGGQDKKLNLFQVSHYHHGRRPHHHHHLNACVVCVSCVRCVCVCVQIDGKKNRKVQGVVFKDTPIVKAWFSPDGREAIVTGRKPWIYVYDVVTGKVSKAWYPAGTHPPHTHAPPHRTRTTAHNTHREP